MKKPIERAILIDDQRIDQRQYKRVIDLSHLVDEVITFSYAEDALTFMRENPNQPVDVIFLDLNMPRMNGFDFLDAAKAEFGSKFDETVVAVLTTSVDPKDKSQAKSYVVVDEFINKPLKVAHIEKIAEIFNNQ